MGPTITATLSMVVAAVIGWWAARHRGALSTAVSGISKVPAAVSSAVIGVGFILSFAGPPFRLGGTAVILLLAYVVVSMPEASLMAEAAVSKVGTDLGEASSISGVGQARTFASVYFPLMIPGLLAGWALVFVRLVGDLTISVLLSGASNPVIGTQILELFENGGYAQMAALALIVTTVSATVLSVMVYGGSRWAGRKGRAG